MEAWESGGMINKKLISGCLLLLLRTSIISERFIHFHILSFLLPILPLNMASDKTTREKKYADACVQTSAAYQESRLATPSTSAKHVTYVGRSAPGVRTEESPTGKVYPRTPINLVRHSNAYKGLRQRDSPSIPQVERRLVSLPARFEENSLSEQLARSFATGARTVSMPTRLRRVTRTIAEQEDPSQHSMSFSSSEECYSASDFKVHFYDVPYTPSLLSDSNSFDATDDKLAMPHHYMSVHDAPEVPSKETQFGKILIFPTYKISLNILQIGSLGLSLYLNPSPLFTARHLFRMLGALRKSFQMHRRSVCQLILLQRGRRNDNRGAEGCTRPDMGSAK